MKIIILAVGKDKAAFYEGALAEYEKRLSRWTKTNWQVVPTSDLQTESEALLRALPKDAYIILLDERGKQWSTMELSKQIEKLQNSGTQSVVFIIGGAHGVSDQVRNKVDHIWGLSDLIFPHEMVRLILVEQLYRAYDILNNGNYHHQ